MIQLVLLNYKRKRKGDVIVSDENKNNAESPNPGEVNYVYQNRRYVGRKETVGFVLWDAAQSFNINTYSGRFVTNVLQIDLGLQAIEQTINGIWDVVNDIFMGAIIDKTRTRWGKFRPYLLLLAIPGLILTALYWLLPILFAGRTSMDLTKFVFYFVLAFIREGISTFQDISRTGLLSTITPHPVDRTRLITLANFASGTFGEKLPDQITTVILDLIDNKVLTKTFNATQKQLYLVTFVGMGLFTTIVSSGMSMWFFMNSRERIMQSVESPSLKQSFKSILNNKPVLLLTLSDFLNSFGLSGSKQDYYVDVLHFASMTLIAGIPAAPLSPVSYSYVPWLRRKFSSKVLYIFSRYIDNILKVPIFLIGCIGMKKDFSGGIYQNKWAMCVVMMVWEIIWTLFYGLKSVIGTEMYNESMDYCEWKNGYRTEAMTSVAKGLAAKVANKVSAVLSTILKKAVNYNTSAYVEGREQPNSVKFYLFAMFTIVPALTSSFGIIPMLFYDLDGKKKEQMYNELLERRAAMQQKVNADAKKVTSASASESAGE